jgi:hypothetical protein
MNRKLIAIFVVTALFLFPLFGGTVFAPSGTAIPPLFNVFVTNTSANPVPVNITNGNINVNLDEPIEVTNPSGESLKTDVSGWLHTTQEDASALAWACPGGAIPFFTKETKGYREITIKFLVWEGADAKFEVLFGIEGPSGSCSFIVDEFTLTHAEYQGVVKTYAIQGSEIMIRAASMDAVTNSRVILWYYMTT